MNKSPSGKPGAVQSDTFVFAVDYDEDRVLDYVDAEELLAFDDALWGGGLTAQQVVDTFATVIAGDVQFDFGGGDIFWVENQANARDPVNNVLIF